ncbi:MAG: NAD(P)-dependent oxidoreductase [Elusimicrobia bacterium]|nr:NAD(P)-dependent oxidoreductase [Elusimicrobiota bacterium]
MNILVTGAAGYIGSVLVPLLLERGHRVSAVDSFMYGQTSLLDCCRHEGLSIIRGDARDKNLIAGLLKKADAIIPLACLTGAPLTDKDPWTSRAVTLDAVRMLLDMRGRGQRVIFPTTNSGYGIGRKGVPCDEASPLQPVSLYGQLKVEAERAVLDAGDSVTFRLATAFGVSPRMRLDLLVNDFVYRALYDGFVVLFEADFKRNYIHVRDVARAFLHCLDRWDRMKGEPYNVGLSDCNLSKRELCEAIKELLPRFCFMEAKVGNDPDQRDYTVSNAKIEAAGFKPEMSLRQGIIELIKGYQVLKRSQYANV